MELDIFRSPRKNAWFFGRYSRNPGEEDYGVYIRVYGDRLYAKTTWERKWKKATIEEILNLILEIYEEVRSW